VKSGAGQLKFRRIPYLQRVIKVAVNESGAFAAIRVDGKATSIALTGKTLEEDLSSLQPHVRRFEHQMTSEDFGKISEKLEEDEEDASTSVSKDITTALQLCAIVKRWRTSAEDSLFSWSEPLLGSDIKVVVGDFAIPAHSIILYNRIPKLANLRNQKLPRISLSKDGINIKVDAATLSLLFYCSNTSTQMMSQRSGTVGLDELFKASMPISNYLSIRSNWI